MSVERINPSALHAPRGWTHVTSVPAAGSLVFVSGMTGRTQDGAMCSGLAAQTEQAYRNLGEALNAAGASVEHVLKETVFIVGLDSASSGDIWPIRSRFWGESLPASTVLGVSALAHPQCLIEIEAVAHVH